MLYVNDFNVHIKTLKSIYSLFYNIYVRIINDQFECSLNLRLR